MQTQFDKLANSHTLQACVEETCRSLLGVDMVAAKRDIPKGTPLLTCCISLARAGSQKSYLLIVNCDNNLLDNISETIYGKDTDSIDVNDMLSVLQELTNMIGGELIKVIEQEFHLGLPYTMDLADELLSIAPEEQLAQTTLEYNNHYINVILTTC